MTSATNEELAVRIRQGERDLMGYLWEQTRDLIAMLAGRWYRSHAESCRQAGVTGEDLMQSGYLALCAAVEAFDPDKGKLVTFLAWQLRAEFLRAVRGTKRHPDPLTVSVSLDAPTAGEDGEIPLIDTVPAEDDPLEETEERIFREQLRAALEDLLDRLPTAEGETIRDRYFRGWTIAATAAAQGKSSARIQQLQTRALRTLRRPQYARYLLPFLMPEAYAWSGTGLQSFQNRQGSSVERAVERAEYEREKAASRIRESVVENTDHQ